MSNINQTQNLFAIDAVQDLDNETAATCSGGVGYLNSSDPDLILYKDPNSQGQSLGVNAATGDGIPNIGFSDGQGGGSNTTFNDQTSSIWIKRGVWQFYEDEKYNVIGNVFKQPTATARLGPGYYNLGANDDKITSLKRIF